MRRVWTIGAASVLCLALGGGPVAAQEEVEEPASINHSSLEEGTPADVVAPGATTYTPRDVRQLRGLEATWTQEHSDPRLSGTVTFVYNEDGYPDWMGPKWGHTTIENAGGSWVGWTLGMEVPRNEPERFPVYVGMLTGTGGHEGLSAMCHTTFPEGPGWSGAVEECLVFEGPLPDISTPNAE